MIYVPDTFYCTVSCRNRHRGRKTSQLLWALALLLTNIDVEASDLRQVIADTGASLLASRS